MDTVGVLVVAAVVGLVLVSLGADRRPATGGGRVTDRRAVAPTSTRAAPVTTAVGAPTVTTPATTAPPTTTATTDPGALPQTDEHPAASGATFTAGVQGLVAGDPAGPARAGDAVLLPEEPRTSR